MEGSGIYDGDVVVCQRPHIPSLTRATIVLLEKSSNEPNAGAFALKIVKFDPLAGEDVDWDKQTLTLKSTNKLFKPSSLDPTGTYRYIADYRRTFRPYDVSVVQAGQVMTLVLERRLVGS